VQKGELPYLAAWAEVLATISVRLPPQQLEAVCSFVGQHLQELTPRDRERLLKAFEAWGYEPGLALLHP